MEIQTQPTCLNCKYFIPQTDDKGQTTPVGRCCRYPRTAFLQIVPSSVVGGGVQQVEMSQFPLTPSTEWCGEFVQAAIPPTAGQA